MKHERGDAAESMRVRPRTDNGPLFGEPAESASPTVPPRVIPPPDTPGWKQRWLSLTKEQRVAQRERWKERLLPIVEEFSETRGPEGFMASDVESRALSDHILPDGLIAVDFRVYSFIGPWLASLAKQRKIAPKTERLANGGVIHVKGKSERDDSNGNEGYRYVGLRFAA